MNSFKIDFNYSSKQNVIVYECFPSNNLSNISDVDRGTHNLINEVDKYINCNRFLGFKRRNNSNIYKQEQDKEEHDKKVSIKIKCKCRNSQCLKSYCDCFAAGQYCVDCNCLNCKNTPENKDTIIYLKSFRSRKNIGINESGNDDTNSVTCKCTNSQCQKKYCECFKANLSCSEKCRCINCLNSIKKSNRSKVSKSKETSNINISYEQVTNKLEKTKKIDEIVSKNNNLVSAHILDNNEEENYYNREQQERLEHLENKLKYHISGANKN